MNPAEGLGEQTRADRARGAVETDLRNGALRPLADYLRLYPGDDAAVAAAYLAAVRAEAPSAAGPLVVADRYVIKREIGRGGQGAVYEAFDARLKRPVALKTLLRRPRLDDPSRLRFRREAELASRLDDPGICPVYDAGFHDGVPYLAMKLVAGEAWSRVLAARRIAARRPDGDSAAGRSGAPSVPTKQEIDEAVRRARFVALSLHVAHEAGVVHRDVKPGNIVLVPDGRPVVLDFGLAYDESPDAESLTDTGEALGTPAYMAPEQVSGDPVDRRADVWALGVVLYEALTLRRPFDGATRVALSREILAGTPPPLRELNPEVSRDLAAVVGAALERSPARRYATAAAFAEDLRRVAAKEPILARPPGPFGRLVRYVERRPARAAAGAAIVLSAAAGTGVAFYGLAQQARTLVEYERLADVKILRDLRRESEDLFPAYPALLPRLETALATADLLVAGLPKHEADLAALEAAVAAAPSASDPATLWRRETLRGLVADLRVCAEPENGLRAELARRRAATQSITGETVSGDAARAWEEARAFIADRSRAPWYGGQAPEPRLGLVPLGPDPESGRYAFYAPQTGARPALHGPPRADDAIVFMLVPGGTARLGSPAAETGRADDEAERVVTLPAFYLARAETTRAQWRRIMGEIPLPALPDAPSDSAAADLLPATERTWTEAQRAARRLGFVLPSADAWEAACRAGTRTRFAYGDDVEDLAAAANIADASFRAAHTTSPINAAPFDDGVAGLRAAGLGAPNANGLCDLHGNAAEWCSDATPEDGRGGPRRIAKGGSYLMTADDARAARRLKFHPEARSAALGVRFAAELAAPEIPDQPSAR
jgi:formylglycine-generating enzyme required for sulfatase activity/tRNA A-37 threonylcarbamoyl transferase component Bud32